MPAFIKTPQDEARWEKAKQAANKSHSESEGDSYWAIVNSIYQKITKAIDTALELDNATALSKAIDMLKKARKKISDEYDPYEDPGDQDETGKGFTEFDPDASEREIDNEEPSSEDDEQYQKDTDPEWVKPTAEEATPEEQATVEGDPTEEVPEAEKEVAQHSRFRQPTSEELQDLRAYTQPLVHRNREIQQLQADPKKNPVLAHRGHIVEARNEAFSDWDKAYNDMINSDEYKKADRLTKMKMSQKLKSDFHANNPTHLKEALQAHNEAHKKGLEGKDIHAAEKEAKIRNVLQGGTHDPGAVSAQEGLQHVGGVKGEEGITGTIKQDPATAFAHSNQDFIKEYAKKYNQQAGNVKNIDEMADYDDTAKRDIGRILGQGPEKNPKFEKFFEHYYPLIRMNAVGVMRKLGLDKKSSDFETGLLHEAGMHGLMQAINDYDHEHPSKASFATHASNKIKGLMHSALKSVDEIPPELRQAQKAHAKSKMTMQPEVPAAQPAMQPQSQAPMTQPSKVVRRSKDIMAKHPRNSEISTRISRINSQKAAAPLQKPVGMFMHEDDEGGEQ